MDTSRLTDFPMFGVLRLCLALFLAWGLIGCQESDDRSAARKPAASTASKEPKSSQPSSSQSQPSVSESYSGQSYSKQVPKEEVVEYAYVTQETVTGIVAARGATGERIQRKSAGHSSSEQSSGGPANRPQANESLRQYKAELGVDAELAFPGQPGEMRVWIGDAQYSANFSDAMAQDQAVLGVAGQTAKVKPYAPAFDIEPAESVCIKVHPSGSEVRFSLIPKQAGQFKVGADVSLYASADCSGVPVPKSVSSLAVEVRVNVVGLVRLRAQELWNIFWEKALEFWGTLVLLGFGLVLFLIRKQISQRFGFRAA